ncbi:hypothetical protein AVEN_135645-1 [Araneus ventricosus]|uniref:Uncharacterized protein n=1 Tax=Araneus ventricosus TaxID=182803 RepID=A0A4Y2EJN9_ARAVE|nr:hypothetical protein AVEN_135645-1 [Araneus ventricosus]
MTLENTRVQRSEGPDGETKKGAPDFRGTWALRFEGSWSDGTECVFRTVTGQRRRVNQQVVAAEEVRLESCHAGVKLGIHERERLSQLSQRLVRIPLILVEKLGKTFTDVPKLVLRQGSKSQNSSLPSPPPPHGVLRVSFLASTEVSM